MFKSTSSQSTKLRVSSQLAFAVFTQQQVSTWPQPHQGWQQEPCSNVMYALQCSPSYPRAEAGRSVREVLHHPTNS